jgi:hypothetical protein
MAKSNSSFNLSKTVKYKMAGIIDPVARNFYKKMMIDAELSYAASKNRKFSDPAVAQKGGNRPQQPTTGTTE